MTAKRQLEGVSETALEVPMPQEYLASYLQKHRISYGYEPDDVDRRWPHLMGRVRKETDTRNFTAIASNRCGPEVEGGKHLATRTWGATPGVTTTAGGKAGFERVV